MQKEPLGQSTRFKMFLATIIFEALVFLTSWGAEVYGWSVPTDFLRQISVTVAALAGALILGRSYRNTKS